MNQQGKNHNLIEYLTTLLSSSVNESSDYNCPAGISEQSFSPSLPDSPNALTAYEVINFMDEMPGGFLIYHADEDEQIIYANKGLLRIFQCDTLEEFQELTGNSFKGIVHPDDLEEVEKSIREQIAHSQYDLDYVEYRIIRKNGTIRWVEDYGHFINSEAIGNIFYVFIGDATEKRSRRLVEKATLIQEKKQKEQKIQKLIEKYHKERKIINQEQLQRLEVIEGLSVNYESILYADLNTNEILPYRLSSRTKQQFGRRYQTREFLWFVSNYVNMWVHSDDRQFVKKLTSPDYIREKLSRDQTYYVNFRIIKDEKTQYLQLRIVNVGSMEHPSQIVMGYRRMDEEILREMEQKQILEEALNNAKLANIAKDAFLSNMSHDMRTPLNAIFGFTMLAKEHINEAETAAGYLAKIETAGRQLLGLIDKVLEISWSETNDTTIEEAPCNLSDIIQEVYKKLLFQASEKNIALSLDTSGLEHSDVYSDSDKLKQVFQYLVNNAVTYTKNDGKVDIILTESEKLPNEYAVYRFIVQDTGIGISKDFLEHIFEPFEREKNTTISGIHGSGLGLTIARNIVDRMGGNINIESTAGIGSKFTVTLRLRIQDNSLPASIDTEYVMAQLLNQKILLVEDNEINLEIETEILKGLGFHIETAVNGSIAFEKMKVAEPEEYALVLMDIQMPVMDGREAAKAIRRLENPETARIPIIALSADAFEHDKRLSIECGMDAHLTKPIDIPLLLETIVKIMQNRKAT